MSSQRLTFSFRFWRRVEISSVQEQYCDLRFSGGGERLLSSPKVALSETTAQFPKTSFCGSSVAKTTSFKLFRRAFQNRVGAEFTRSVSSRLSDAAIISKLESNIKPSDIPLRYLPAHPPIIAQYARYYFGYKADNHRMIRGELILPFRSKMKPAGIYVVGSQREFPTIFDGGCAVIHVVYDVEAGHMISLQCNGDA